MRFQPQQIVSLATERTPLRWVPPEIIATPERVTAGGIEREAFLLEPPARIDWTVYALAPAAIRTWCALDTSDPTVKACLAIEARHGNDRVEARIELTAATGWREVRLPLPDAFTAETNVAFVASASVDGRCRIACADAVLERRRRLSEIARAGIAAGRFLGVRGSVRRAAASAQQAEADEQYRRWLRSQAARRQPPSPRGPLISIVTPVFNTDPVWLRQCIHSVLRQTYPRWELVLADDGSRDARTLEVLRSVEADSRITVVTCPPGHGGIARATNAALAAARGEFVAFLDHDDELAPEALDEAARVIAAEPALDVVYTDEDKIDPSGVHSQPHFKPDWSPELLYSCMYASHLTVIRRRLVEEVGGVRTEYEGSQDYDLLLRVSERTTRIAHVPQILYHWRTAPMSAASSLLAKPWAMRAGRRALEDALTRRNLRAAVLPTQASGHFRVRYEIVGSPRVSAIVTWVPPGTSAAAIRRWQQTIHNTAPHVAEILTPDGVSDLGRQLSRATGDHLLLLHADVEPTSAGWLEALLEFSQQPPIGAVAPFLIGRDGTIDHAGLVVGAGGVAASAFAGDPAMTRGHLSNTFDVRNCSAVSGACLLTRRDAFERAGGLDPRLPPGIAALDYSMRLRETGLRIVVTPHARLSHARDCGATVEDDPVALQRLRDRWGDRLDRDPFYNPNFDRRDARFRLPEDPVICQTR